MFEWTVFEWTVFEWMVFEWTVFEWMERSGSSAKSAEIKSLMLLLISISLSLIRILISLLSFCLFTVIVLREESGGRKPE